LAAPNLAADAQLGAGCLADGDFAFEHGGEVVLKDSIGILGILTKPDSAPGRFTAEVLNVAWFPDARWTTHPNMRNLACRLLSSPTIIRFCGRFGLIKSG